jgi:hypothetical protein
MDENGLIQVPASIMTSFYELTCFYISRCQLSSCAKMDSDEFTLKVEGMN